MKFALFFALTILAVNSFPSEHFLNENLRENFDGDIWAVLVAGSNGWYNYRHQADICHAYQVLHKRGIPDDRIIVMMYDDIANNEENPDKGFIKNHPNGPNVYPGVPKDYTGDDVTPDNFLGVLLGNETLEKSGKKVLKSGPKDHVFVYFADHGAPGLIAFPNDLELDAGPFNKALRQMHKEKKYGKMVIYIEACESGSMFEKRLKKNMNIYATTAANSEESSYACYFDDKLQNYLGDVYSVKWIENSESSSYGTETLKQQYQIVKKETNTSHVQQFGDLKLSSMPLTMFQGPKTGFQFKPVTFKIVDAVPSPDVPLLIAAKKAMSGNCDDCVHQFETLLSGRRYMNETVAKIIAQISNKFNVAFDHLWTSKQLIYDDHCYMKLKSTFKQNCFGHARHPYALRFLYTLVNVCNAAQHNNDLIQAANFIIKSYCVNNVNAEMFGRIL